MLKYVTGNEAKFKSAKNLLTDFGIEIEQIKIDIKEIQSESIEEISKDKARKSFEIVKEPLIVNDSGWYFLGLKGFPGPFMKYVNNWFGENNFLDLTRNMDNKEVILKQVVVYFDGKEMKVFEHQTKCHLLDKAKGNSPRKSDNVIAPWGSEITFGEVTEKEDFKLEGEEMLWKEVVEYIKMMGY